MNAIEVSQLRRMYKTTIGVIRRKTKEVVAVEDVSFGAQPGELFGLLRQTARARPPLSKC